MQKIATLFLAFALLFCLAACDSNVDNGQKAPEQSKNSIKVGCVEPSLAILKIAVEYANAKGYDFEIVLIEGNVNVIRAVNDGSVEAGLGVHLKFMEKFNADNKGDLVMVKPYAYYGGMGLYSDKYDSVDAIPVGGKIAIMNDAMNMDRALKILRSAGLIQLNEQAPGPFSLVDVTGNPKKLELIDMDQIQTVRSLQDVDAAVVFFSHMANAGRNCLDYLIQDDDADQYPSAIVVKQANAEAPWAKALEDGLRSEGVRQHIEEVYKGVYSFYE